MAKCKHYDYCHTRRWAIFPLNGLESKCDQFEHPLCETYNHYEIELRDPESLGSFERELGQEGSNRVQ